MYITNFIATMWHYHNYICITDISILFLISRKINIYYQIIINNIGRSLPQQ